MDAETVEALLTAARTTGQPVQVPGLAPFVVLPHGFKVESLAELGLLPSRVTQRVTVQTPEDFVRYFLRYQNTDSIVMADEKGGTYTGILDYHKKTAPADAAPDWTSHAVIYACPFSPEWTVWTKNNDQAMEQEAFALFMESNYVDITEPAHADMIEVSRSLAVNKSVNFHKSSRLSDGRTQFNYTEQMEGTAQGKAGQITVPDEFKLAIPVFTGGVRFEILAKLRYRLQGSQLRMWYSLQRADRVRDAAVQEVTAKVRKGLEKAADRLFIGSTNFKV